MYTGDTFPEDKVAQATLLHPVQRSIMVELYLNLLIRLQGIRLEIDHSSPSSADVYNGGTIPPPPHTSSRHGA
jgi:hypothetical protein